MKNTPSTTRTYIEDAWGETGSATDPPTIAGEPGRIQSPADVPNDLVQQLGEEMPASPATSASAARSETVGSIRAADPFMDPLL